MKFSTSLSVVFAAAAMVAQAGLRPDMADGLAATVNQDAITISEVFRGINPYLADAARKAGPNATEDSILRSAWLTALRDQENKRLVIQKYNEGDKKLPPNAIERQASEILQNRYKGNLAELQADLAHDHLTYTEWKDQLMEGMIVAAMRQFNVDGNVHVSPTDVTATYQKQINRFTIPDTMRVWMASFQAEDSASSALLPSDKPFGERFAGQDGVTVRDCGDIVPADELAAPLADALARAKDGETVGPVYLAGKYYVLFRESSKGATVRPLEEVWTQIETELRNEQRDTLFKQWVNRLRATAEIREFSPFED